MVQRRSKVPGELKKERMVLSGADRDVFLEVLIQPKEPAEKLVLALRRHQAVAG